MLDSMAVTALDARAGVYARPQALLACAPLEREKEREGEREREREREREKERGGERVRKGPPPPSPH